MDDRVEDDAHNLYKRGKTYWFRATIGGREYRESLRTTSKSVAVKSRNARLKALQRSAENSGGLRQFFVAAVVEFINALTKGGAFTWSETTTERYACSMRAIARAMVEISEDNDVNINALYMDQFDVATVSDLVARRSQIVKLSTVNRDITALGHFAVFCKNRQWIDANPVASYEKQGMKEVLPPINLPTDEALARMIKRGPLTFGCLVRFIDYEGTRATETARIAWPDIEFDPNNPSRAMATLRHAKGGVQRVITLAPETVEMLRAMPRSNRSPYVFFNDGDEGWYRDLSTRFWEYGQDVRFGARLHDLRHRFAIRKLKEGWSIYRVSEHLGHKSVTTTERYYLRHLTAEQKARARDSGNNGFAEVPPSGG